MAGAVPDMYCHIFPAHFSATVTAMLSYEITTMRSAQWLCELAQNVIRCGQWDAAGQKSSLVQT